MSRNNGLVFGLLFCFFELSCSGNDEDAFFSQNKPERSSLVCSTEQIHQSGLQHSGIVSEKEAILPNGRRISPVGNIIYTGSFPIGIQLNKDETIAYITHNGDKDNALMVIDLASGEKKQIYKIKSTFRGVTLSKDEKKLFVGGGNTGKLLIFEVLEDWTVVEDGEIFLNGYIADVAISSDGKTIFALSNTNSYIYMIDAENREVTHKFKSNTLPYDMIVSQDKDRLFVSNMGSSDVWVFDIGMKNLVKSIPVGKNPEVMALSPDGGRLFVASSDSDSVSVIDMTSLDVVSTIDLTKHPLLYKGANVNGVAISPDGKRLYVTEAGMNLVDVIDTEKYKILGAIPTGWYPTEVVAGQKGIYVLVSKGMGSKASLKDIPGFLQIIPYPDDNQLAEYTTVVEDNNTRTLKFFKEPCTPETHPVLSGKKSPIEHVVLIVRENKTYDMLLGDMEKGDGDPNLVVYPENITPNFHALAREFVNLDNYYSNPENSVQGHMWTTTAHCNDYVEKLWLDQLPIAGYDPASYHEGGSIFDHLFAHGIPFRNYGEFPTFAPKMFGDFMPYFDAKYPFWTMAVKDVDKAQEVIREMELGLFSNFIYIVLPNDHTYGTKPGMPTPQSMVADNDRATGMLVQAISNSIYWPKTVIFIIEDDPQGSGDHVEAHRSVCVVVSPWVKRGYVSSVHYDIPSLYKTIEMILGVPPLNKNDLLAPLMLDIWVDGEVEKPNYTPFEALPVDVPDEIVPKNAPMADMMERCNFDKIDGCEGLGMAQWKWMKGDIPLPPYAKGIDR